MGGNSPQKHVMALPAGLVTEPLLLEPISTSTSSTPTTRSPGTGLLIGAGRLPPPLSVTPSPSQSSRGSANFDSQMGSIHDVSRRSAELFQVGTQCSANSHDSEDSL